MTEASGAAAPTTEQTAVSAPAVSEQATSTESVAQSADATTENAETNQETEQAATDGDTSTDEPKRLTRNQRLQRKAARLSTMVAEQAAELERLRQATAKSAEEGAPKEADFNGDYFAYQTAKAAYDAAQLVRKDLNERDQRNHAQSLQERVREANEEFLERVEDVKKGVPDYDSVLDGFVKAGGQFAPHVIEEVRDSDKGPMLAYHIAKTPGLAAELNALSARDAAREIGRIEAKLSLPQPKKQTQAPAPLSVLKGGAAPTTDLASLAKSDDASAYIAARRAQQKARA